jgi:hypothetical protein
MYITHGYRKKCSRSTRLHFLQGLKANLLPSLGALRSPFLVLPTTIAPLNCGQVSNATRDSYQ